MGNHEFDEGIQSLSNFLEKVEFPVLAANLNVKSEPALQIKSLRNSTVFERNGVKIGVIGYLTPETMRISTANKIEITEEIEAIKSVFSSGF